MKRVYYILFVLWIVCLPVFSVTAAGNLMFRAPDLYAFEFTKAQISSETGVQLNEEELSQFFSDFMLGKKKEFSFEVEYREQGQELFNMNEQIIMEQFRDMLNLTALAGCAALLFLILFTWFFVRKEWREPLRKGFKLSLALFGAFWIALFIMVEVEGGRALGYRLIASQPIGADDILPRLVTEVFVQDAFWVGFVISAILTSIIGYVIYKFTKPRRMFW